MGSVGWDLKAHLFLVLLLSVHEKKIKKCSELAGTVERPWTGLLGTFSQSRMKQKPHKHKMPYFMVHGEQPFLLGVLQVTLCRV